MIDSETKVEVLRRLIRNGESVSDLAAEIGVDPNDIEGWVDELLERSVAIFENPEVSARRGCLRGGFSIFGLMLLTFVVALNLAFPKLLLALVFSSIVSFFGTILVGMPIMLVIAMTSPVKDGHLDVGNNGAFRGLLYLFLTASLVVYLYFVILLFLEESALAPLGPWFW